MPGWFSWKVIHVHTLINHSVQFSEKFIFFIRSWSWVTLTQNWSIFIYILKVIFSYSIYYVKYVLHFQYFCNIKLNNCLEKYFRVLFLFFVFYLIYANMSKIYLGKAGIYCVNWGTKFSNFAFGLNSGLLYLFTKQC